MVIEGLKNLLSKDFEIVGTVDDGAALLAAAKKLKPDVIVTDVAMPNLNGIDALTRLKSDNPDVRVVFLTMHQDGAYARRALEAGALGFVVKHSASTELIMAINSALQGRTFITPRLTGAVLNEVRNGAQSTAVSLTPRQREILQLLAEGRSAKDIAKQLAISARTVEFHKYQIMEAHGLHNSAELVHLAIKRGLVKI